MKTKLPPDWRMKKRILKGIKKLELIKKRKKVRKKCLNCGKRERAKHRKYCKNCMKKLRVK